MKLVSKLLAAPLLTALVVFSAGQLNALLTAREASANQASFEAGFETSARSAALQEQLGQVHAGVYRTVALIASLDDAKIKAFRADLANAGGRRQARRPRCRRRRRRHGAARPVTALRQADRQVPGARPTRPSTCPRSTRTPASPRCRAPTPPSPRCPDLSRWLKRVEARSAARPWPAPDAAHAHMALAAGRWRAAAARRSRSWLSWLMQRQLVAELHRAADIAGGVAAGNLAVDAHSDARTTKSATCCARSAR